MTIIPTLFLLFNTPTFVLISLIRLWG